jgi:hypothetical protein
MRKLWALLKERGGGREEKRRKMYFITWENLIFLLALL